MRPKGVSLRNPIHLLALGLGSGLAPRAPGTWGTVAAVPLFLLLEPLPAAVYWGVLLFAFGIGVWACGLTARAMGVDDHPAIVWDEVVGFLVAMGASSAGLFHIALGFVLFRLFDIWKPWPDQSVGQGASRWSGYHAGRRCGGRFRPVYDCGGDRFVGMNCEFHGVRVP